MYPKLSRLIVLFAMLVCLPLNGMAALVMPACETHGQAMVMHAEDGKMDAMPGCGHHDTKPQSGKAPCDKCFSCQMPSAQAITPFFLSVSVAVDVQQFSAVMAKKPQSISSSLFRPPITTFA